MWTFRDILHFIGYYMHFFVIMDKQVLNKQCHVSQPLIDTINPLTRFQAFPQISTGARY